MRALLAAILLNAAAFAHPQSMPDPRPRAEMASRSKDWQERAHAFYTFSRCRQNNDPSSQTELARVLTDLLETETAFQSSGIAPATEEYSNYYGDLIQAVTTLRDPLSLTVLLKCINTGGMAIGALATMGDAAFIHASQMLTDSDTETHRNLVALFSTMAEPANYDRLKEKSSRDNLLLALLNAATENDPYVRVASVRGLTFFSASPDAVATLLRLAVSDDFATTSNGNARYPVREAAVTAIEQAAR